MVALHQGGLRSAWEVERIARAGRVAQRRIVDPKLDKLANQVDVGVRAARAVDANGDGGDFVGGPTCGFGSRSLPAGLNQDSQRRRDL